MLEVVWVILWRNNRFLLTQRSLNDRSGRIWAFPGRKINQDDATPIVAIRRELKEEVNLIPRRLRKLTAIHQDECHIQIFFCNKWDREPRPASKDIMRVGWFTLVEMYALGQSLAPCVNNSLVYISYLIQHYGNHPNEWREQWRECDGSV